MLGYMLFHWVNGGLDVSGVFLVLLFYVLLIYGTKNKKQGDQHFHNHFADDTERAVNDTQTGIQSRTDQT